MRTRLGPPERKRGGRGVISATDSRTGVITAYACDLWTHRARRAVTTHTPPLTRKRGSRPVRQSAQPRHADQFDCFFEVAVWRLGVSARAHNLGTSQPPVPSHIGTRVILAVSVGIDITPLETKTNIRVGLIRWSMPGLDHLRKDNLSKCRLSNHVSQRG